MAISGVTWKRRLPWMGLAEELSGPRKGGARTGPAVVVRPEGAAQVALIGPPNSGKSSLHVRLTGSHAVVGPYPFTTKLPLPGMLAYEDVQFQLVDLPPLSADFAEPWMGNALEPAEDAWADAFRIRLPTALLANESDLLAAPAGELEVFQQLLDVRLPTLAVYAETGHGLADVGRLLFERDRDVVELHW
jgi:uncharacterized protein